MKQLAKVSAIFDGSIGFLAFFAGVLLTYAMLIVGAEVTARYLGGSIIFAIESAEYSLLWITFLGAAWVLKRERHVRMELLLNRLSPRTRSLFNFSTSILGIIICLVITWFGISTTRYFFETGSVLVTLLRPLRWPIMVIIPVGSFLLFVQFIRRAYGYLAELKSVTTQREKLVEEIRDLDL